MIPPLTLTAVQSINTKLWDISIISIFSHSFMSCIIHTTQHLQEAQAK